MSIDQIQASGEQAGAASDEAALLARLEDRLDEAYGRLRRQCREHPAAVVAAAIGVGLILGALIGRRR